MLVLILYNKRIRFFKRSTLIDFQILVLNLTNPTLLFFVLGIIATTIKSDLEIPSGQVAADLTHNTKLDCLIHF